MIARPHLVALALAFGCAFVACKDETTGAGFDAAISADGGIDAMLVCGDGLGCPLFTECATQGVVEVQLEPDELGMCQATDTLIGRGAPSWGWQSGGRALADRLCVAQGLTSSRSAGATAIRSVQKEQLAMAGLRMLRIDFGWSRIEPTPGSFDFSGFDELVDAADASGLEILAILAYGVPWATTQTDSDNKFPPDDPADFANYATEVALRFAGRIRYYEIWNEQNGGYRFWKPTVHGDADAFGRLMTVTASALRAACADCVIISGGLFFHEQVINGAIEFTHDMLTAHPGALDDIDLFGLHPYPQYPPAAPPEQTSSWGERGLGAMVADLVAVLAVHDVPALPFAVTEVGWPVSGAVDEAIQAEYLAREILLGASLGLDPLCWYNLTDGPEPTAFPPENAFGLYHHGSEDPAGTISPKPAALAMGWLGSLGAGAVPAGPNSDLGWHDPEAGRFALDFDAPGGRWTAVWSLEPQDMDFAGETRSSYDLFGTLLAQPSGGVLRVVVGPSVVYLVP